MVHKLKEKDSYSRKVLTLMTGTALAQLIPIIGAPILTRLYSPEEFGMFSAYLAVVSILSIVSTGRYELAIVLPKSDTDALGLLIISIGFLTTFCILLWMFFLFLPDFNYPILNDSGVLEWLYVIPVSVFFAGCYQAVYAWSVRKERYQIIATNKMVQSGGVVFVQILSKAIFEKGGLIIGSIVGAGVSLFSLFYRQRKDFSTRKVFCKTEELVVLLKRYSDFLKFDVLASLFNSISQQAPNILFLIMFGPIYAGFFGLMQRVLQAPITLISASFLDVFKKEASTEYEKTGGAIIIFKKTFYRLFLIAFFPTILLYFSLDYIFSFVFGEEWFVAGDYAKIMLPALFLRFMSNPLSFMFYVAGKQLVNMLGMAFLCCSILAGFFVIEDHYLLVCYISVVYSIVYMLYIILSAKFARVF